MFVAFSTTDLILSRAVLFGSSFLGTDFPATNVTFAALATSAQLALARAVAGALVLLMPSDVKVRFTVMGALPLGASAFKTPGLVPSQRPRLALW